MAFLPWSSKYSVNIKAIDAQHQRLFELVNELHDYMMQGKGGLILKSTLASLVDYTQTHFKTEETLMIQHGFQGYASHKVEHDDLTRQVLDLKKQVDDGKIALTIATMNFLKEWLTKHVMGTDMKYKDYLNSRGVS